MKFSEYIYNRLNYLGYDTVFGVPGYYIMPTWQQFKEKPKVVLARHESGAAYMADGWTKITGKPGIVLTTLGPGQTNVTTGIASAYKDSIPMIVITGQANVETFGKGVFQECYKVDRGFSTTELFQPITKASYEITDIKDAVALFEKALKISIEGRPGPVHLSIPYNIQEEEVDNYIVIDSNLMTSFDDFKDYYQQENKYDNAVDMINNSERILILVGWGCYGSGQYEKLKELSEKIGAPVITTIKGLSSVSYYWDMFIGHIGLGQSKKTIDFIEDYDPQIVLVLGASMSNYYTNFVEKVLEKAQLIQVDISSEQIGLRKGVAIEINDSIQNFLPDILKNVEQKQKEQIVMKIKEFKRTSIETEDILYKKDESLMVRTINILNEVLPKNAVVIPDAGNHWLNTLSLYNTKAIGGFFTNCGLGPMGHAIGASIGLKFASKDKKVICISGDGSMLMSGNEISVACEHKLDNIYLIYNNSSMGRVRTYQYFESQEEYISSDIQENDFCKWANSMGAKSFKVKNEYEFRSALEIALSSKITTIIEVTVSKDEIPIFLRR